MKINFKILGKALWETVKFPLMMLAIIVGVVFLFTAMFYFLGISITLSITLILTVLFIVGLVTLDKYNKMMRAYRAEQDCMIDILRGRY